MPCGGGGASGGGASIARLSAARPGAAPVAGERGPRFERPLWIRFPANAKPSAAGPPGEPRAPGASCGGAPEHGGPGPGTGAVAGIDQAGHKRRAWGTGAVAGIDQAGDKRRAWGTGAVAGIDQAGDKRRGPVRPYPRFPCTLWPLASSHREPAALLPGSSSFPPASGDGVAAGVGGPGDEPAGRGGRRVRLPAPRLAAGQGQPPRVHQPGAGPAPLLPPGLRPLQVGAHPPPILLSCAAARLLAKTGASSVNEAWTPTRARLDDLKFNSTGSFVCLSCALTLLSVSAEGGASPPLFTCPSCGDPHPAASGLVCSSRIDALFSFLAYIDDAAFAASWISGDLCLRTALTYALERFQAAAAQARAPPPPPAAAPPRPRGPRRAGPSSGSGSGPEPPPREGGGGAATGPSRSRAKRAATSTKGPARGESAAEQEEGEDGAEERALERRKTLRPPKPASSPDPEAASASASAQGAGPGRGRALRVGGGSSAGSGGGGGGSSGGGGKGKGKGKAAAAPSPSRRARGRRGRRRRLGQRGGRLARRLAGPRARSSRSAGARPSPRRSGPRAARTTPTSSPRAPPGRGRGEGGLDPESLEAYDFGLEAGIDPGLIGRQIDASPEAARPS
eukprot:tig00021535_g22229.t1